MAFHQLFPSFISVINVPLVAKSNNAIVSGSRNNWTFRFVVFGSLISFDH